MGIDIVWCDTEYGGLNESCDIHEVAMISERQQQIEFQEVLYSQPFTSSCVTKEALMIMNCTLDDLWKYPQPEIMYMKFIDLITKLYIMNEYKKLILGGHSIHKDIERLQCFEHRIRQHIDLSNKDNYILFEYLGRGIHHYIDCNRYICTFRLARKLQSRGKYRGGLSLCDIARYFGLSVYNIHTSWYDAYLSRQVYYKLKELV